VIEIVGSGNGAHGLLRFSLISMNK
jgi:hypothetical protein